MRGKTRVRTKRNIKKNNLIMQLIILGTITFIILLFSIIFAVINIGNNKILNGIYLNGCDLSNLTLEQATEKVNNAIQEKEINGITLLHNQNEYFVELSKLDLNYDLALKLNEIISIGRSGNIIADNYTILKCALFKEQIVMNFNFSEEKLKEEIKSIYSRIPDRLVENTYYIEDDELIIVKGIDGIVLKEEQLQSKIAHEIQNLSEQTNKIEIPYENKMAVALNIPDIYNEIYQEAKDAYYTKDPFCIYPEVNGIDFAIETAEIEEILAEKQDSYVIPLNITYPKITTKNLDIEAFPNLLGEQDSKYDVTNKNRANNLKLAAQKIDGIILKPGEIFSYNKTLGARTIENGYKEAAIYADGKVTDGLGGGICQISSILYDAALYANLEIVERENHLFMPSYVKSGLDATVVYGSIDFKFKNNRKYPIRIDATVKNGIAKISIYGIKEDEEYTVELESNIIKVTPYTTTYMLDKSLNDDEEQVWQSGENGLIVETYKILKKLGVEVSKTLISKDKYRPLEEVIAVNKLPEK